MKTIYKIYLAIYFIVWLSCLPSISNAQFIAISNESMVNTTTAGNQYGFWWSPRTVAVQPDGSYIIVWIDLGGLDGQAEGIFGQRFNASGAKIGSQFQVNTSFSGQQFSPSIAVAPNGSFIVAWEGPGASIDIFAQLFTKDGVKNGAEFLLNTTVSGNQRYPEIQYFADGTFVTGFVDGGQTVLQKFDEEARPVGPETRISSGGGNVVIDGLCVRPDNSVLLTWTSNNDVYGQIFDFNLQAIGSQTRVNTYTTGTQEYINARVDAQGNFVAVWQSDGQDGSGMGMYGRRFDKYFNPLSGEFAITTNTTGAQFEPQIAIHSSGRFVIAWSDNNNRDGGGGSPDLAGPGCSVWFREYDANGNAIGAETMVNQSTPGYQGYPVIDINAAGRFIISWEGNGTQTGHIDNYGIYARSYQLNQTGTTSISVSPTNVTASDIITVTMTLTAPASVTNVYPTPPSVSGTNGIFATLVSGPTPSSQTVGTLATSFVWTYRVTAKDKTGQLSFSSNAYSASGVIFPYALSNIITVKAALYVSDITASNLINDSNDPTSGPRVFTIGAKITNLSTNAISNIEIYAGNGATPGTFPSTIRTLGQTNNTYQGTFSLIPLAGTSDCTRGLASLGGAKNVINGRIDFNGDGAITVADDGTLSNGKTVIDGRIDVNKDAVINGSDDLARPPGFFDGYREPSIIDGYVDINGDGVINASDGSTYGGETKNIYWFVKYDVIDAANQPTFGNCNDFADDLPYKWNVWASGNDGGITRTAHYTDYAKVRCELSAASNKVQPSGAYISSFPNRIIAGMIDVNSDGIINGSDDGSFYFAGVIDGKWDVDKSGLINTADDAVIASTYNVIDGYIDLNKDGLINSNDDGLLVGVGQAFSVTFHNATFGTIGNGFDANRDNLWDLDFWIQPIGSTNFSAGSFRLVDIQSDIVGTGGNNPLNGITTHYDNEPYLTRLFDDRLGQSGGFDGTYTYTFEVISSGNSTLNPYQEAASGTNNEKYSNDFPTVGISIYTMPTALAVEGLEVTAKLSKANTATIEWKTETESNSDYFIVERSIDGRIFRPVSNHVKAAGNSSVTKYYQFDDDISTIQQGKIYYRVKEFDITGKVTTSNIALITIKRTVAVSTWPNPFKSSVTVNINSLVPAKMLLRLTNAAGISIRSISQQVEKGITQIELNDLDKLAAGFYLLEVIDTNTGNRTTEKLIKR